jgi:hypothetical protein
MSELSGYVGRTRNMPTSEPEEGKSAPKEPEGERPAPKEPEGERPAPKEPEGERPAPKEPEGEPPAPKEPEGEPPAPKEPEGERPALKEPEGEPPALWAEKDATFRRQWIEGKSKEELIRLIFEIALELKARVDEATKRVATSTAPLSFRPVPAAEVAEFIRLPAVSTKKPEEIAETTWRIMLISSNPGHKPIGLEVYDDVFVGRMTEGASRDLDLTRYGAEEQGVSRRHALLHPTKESLFLIDLGSTNGTFCNAARLKSGVLQELKNHDTISFGRLHFQVKIVGQPGKPA